MQTVAPNCEACGKPDDELRGALMRSGKTNLGNQPDLRAPMLCPDCRFAVVALIKQVKGDVPAEVEAEANTQPV